MGIKNQLSYGVATCCRSWQLQVWLIQVALRGSIDQWSIAWGPHLVGLPQEIEWGNETHWKMGYVWN